MNFELPKNLQCDDLEELKADMMTAMAMNEVIELDMTQVERIDTAGIQLLLSAIRSGRHHAGVLLTNLPVHVSDQLDLLGLSRLYQTTKT